MPGRSILPLFVLAATLGGPQVRGEVVHATANGFEVVVGVALDVSRDDAWRGFVDEIGAWWHPDHTVSGRTEGLYLDARPMGCFCESLGPDNGVVHMMVTIADRPRMLRLTGGLGPLGLKGVSGNMTVEFDETDGITRVVIHYAVGGFHEAGLDAVAPAVDAVLGDALLRFSRHLAATATPPRQSQP